LPPGRYIGGSVESIGDVAGPGCARPPSRLTELERLISGLALNTDPEVFDELLAEVENAALARFPREEVVDAVRRALADAAAASGT
jgi:hypothetical protein